jgi:hypothetical protein
VWLAKMDSELALCESYEFYAKRGEAENWIKDFKVHMKADRLSCHRGS